MCYVFDCEPKEDGVAQDEERTVREEALPEKDAALEVFESVDDQLNPRYTFETFVVGSATSSLTLRPVPGATAGSA